MQNDWNNMLKDEYKKDYFIKLKKFIDSEYAESTIYPAREDIFNALNYTSYANTHVVILGQDPYHGGQAHGLSFSVNPDIPTPKSLQNIFKELKTDMGCYIPNNGYLKKWADQGVLLLNTVLTVKEGIANSHKGKGWETFTDRIIELLNEKDEPLIFLLWGKNAKEKKSLITNPKHLIIESAHPSPFSAGKGFFNSKPFSKTNAFLILTKRKKIDWQIENI